MQVGLHIASFKSSLQLLVHLVQLAVVGEIKHLRVGVLVKHPLHHLLQLLYGEVDALQVHHLQLAHSLGQVVRVGEGQHGVSCAIVAANVELSQVGPRLKKSDHYVVELGPEKPGMFCILQQEKLLLSFLSV